jgi:phytoene synthase
MKEPLEALAELVRRVDQDRWMASRFAPAVIRKRLIALYAFNYEVAHIGETSSDENLGAIRLKFCADAIAAIYEGGTPPAHPVIAPLTEAIHASNLPRSLFDALIEARQADLSPAPFETWSDLDAYLDATSGGLIQLAARICAPTLAFDQGLTNFIRAAGRAWGYAGLTRALRYWSAANRTFFPRRLRESLGVNEVMLYSGQALDHAAASAIRGVLDRANGLLRDVHRYSPAAPKEIFPAIGYIALTSSYIRAASIEPGIMRALFKTSLVARQARLVGAAATGSL